MSKKHIFTHPQYGKIELTPNTRARRIILRARPNAICITVPPGATGQDIEQALSIYGKQLLEERDKQEERKINTGYSIDAPYFSFSIELHEKDSFILKRRGTKYTLQCPTTTDLENGERQEWLRKVISETMRERAKEILPKRLAELATMHKLHYKSVCIRNSHSCWGSCNSKGTINLSIYLVKLPAELIDYVLLHELCHTVEMNHGERFWALLNKACKCDAQIIRQELKKHKCDI